METVTGRQADTSFLHDKAAVLGVTKKEILPVPVQYISTDHSHIIVLFNTNLTQVAHNASLSKPRFNRFVTRETEWSGRETSD